MTPYTALSNALLTFTLLTIVHYSPNTTKMATKFYNPENNAIGSQNGDLPVPHANGVNGVNGENAVPLVEGPRPLNIAIVGAGIGGLAAAIGLRKNGHNVSVNLP
jgi:hypothetical protein